MSSSSRTAQQKLAELEKTDAPFHDQLVEASKFLSLDISSLTNFDYSASKNFHGKEEWVIRWLLKKLQGNEGTSVRLNALSWKLLHHVVRIIPIPVVARLLNERKFMTILCQTLEDEKNLPATAAEKIPAKFAKKESRKRKKPGSPVIEELQVSSQELGEAIVATMSYLANPFGSLIKPLDASHSTVATAELMKSTIRTTADEAAKILGSWLSLCQNSAVWYEGGAFLHPFIQIWESRKLGTDSTADFSRYCTKSLLRLLRVDFESSEPKREWKVQLDRLLARNVILPAKSSPAVRAKLIDAHVVGDINLASQFLENSIRCVQTQGGQSEWITDLFAALKTAIDTSNGGSIPTIDDIFEVNEMLKIIIRYHLKIDIDLLRSIAAKYAFQDEGVVHWGLVSTLLELDSTVFISFSNSTSSTLLKQLLSHITSAAFGENWDHDAEMVIEKITVPLMREFAKDRKLKNFMEHWHDQLCQFYERFQSSDQIVDRFCAWEDDALQNTLRDIMEISLDTARVAELIDWVQSQLQIDGGGSVPAACVLLQAIAGSIYQGTRETVDSLNSLRFSEMLLTENVSKNLSGSENERYSWRKWRVLSSVLSTADYPAKHAIAVWSGWSKELMMCAKVDEDNLQRLNLYNAVRFVFALWDAINRSWVGGNDEPSRDSIERLSIKLIEKMGKYLALYKKRLEDREDPIHQEDDDKDRLWYLSRGSTWYANAYGASLLIEYPKVLELVPKLKSSKRHILDTIVKISSSSVARDHSWAGWKPNKEFPRLWIAALMHEEVLQNTAIHSQLIDVMLDNTTLHREDSDVSDCNIFIAESLAVVPTQLFTRQQRELVMKSWVSNIGSEVPAINPVPASLDDLDPTIWSLKRRMMTLHTFYEGMRFKDFTNMAEELMGCEHYGQTRISVLIPVFGELLKLTIRHILSSADSKMSQLYLREVATFLSNWSQDAKELLARPDSPQIPFLAHIKIIMINMVLRTFTEKVILQTSDILNNELLEEVKTSFKSILISDLKIQLGRVKYGTNPHKDDRKIFFSCALDALEDLDVSEANLQPSLEDILSCLISFHGKLDGCSIDNESAWALTAFVFAHAPIASNKLSLAETIHPLAARLATKRIVEARASRLDATGKVQMAREIAQALVDGVENMEQSHRLGKLIALDYTVAKCEDSKSKEINNDFIGLPVVYSQLSEIMCKSKSSSELCLASEILVNVLQAKENHVIVQHNIDNILGAITLVCSHNGPSIEPKHAGNIFSHLCDLLQAVLSDRDHRRKIKGHSHILLQPMQALLKCLFSPRTKISSRSTRSNPPPPWLSSLPTQTLINFPLAKHVEEFARLITLICDPPTSIVSENKRSDAADLNSARKRAKRDAGEHMIYLLTYYLKLQSEMKLAAEMREMLRPAMWAIMDTTDIEGRGRMVAEMDDRDRPLWHELWKDWNEYGKYKGN